MWRASTGVRVEDDLIRAMLHMVMEMDASFTDAMSAQVEQQLRLQYGGEKVWIKPYPRIPHEKKDKAVKEYLEGMPIEQVVLKNGLSRASLYRHLKKK